MRKEINENNTTKPNRELNNQSKSNNNNNDKKILSEINEIKIKSKYTDATLLSLEYRILIFEHGIVKSNG